RVSRVVFTRLPPAENVRLGHDPLTLVTVPSKLVSCPAVGGAGAGAGGGAGVGAGGGAGDGVGGGVGAGAGVGVGGGGGGGGRGVGRLRRSNRPPGPA